MAIKGDISPSRVVVLYIAVGALYEPVRKLASSVPRVQAGLAGAARIFAYLDREPEVRESPDAVPFPVPTTLHAEEERCSGWPLNPES